MTVSKFFLLSVWVYGQLSEIKQTQICWELIQENEYNCGKDRIIFFNLINNYPFLIGHLWVHNNGQYLYISYLVLLHIDFYESWHCMISSRTQLIYGPAEQYWHGHWKNDEGQDVELALLTKWSEIRLGCHEVRGGRSAKMEEI